jgi:hypothetical protein
MGIAALFYQSISRKPWITAVARNAHDIDMLPCLSCSSCASINRIRLKYVTQLLLWQLRAARGPGKAGKSSAKPMTTLCISAIFCRLDGKIA